MVQLFTDLYTYMRYFKPFGEVEIEIISTIFVRVTVRASRRNEGSFFEFGKNLQREDDYLIYE